MGTGSLSWRKAGPRSRERLKFVLQFGWPETESPCPALVRGLSASSIKCSFCGVQMRPRLPHNKTLT